MAKFNGKPLINMPPLEMCIYISAYAHRLTYTWIVQPDKKMPLAPF